MVAYDPMNESSLLLSRSGYRPSRPVSFVPDEIATAIFMSNFAYMVYDAKDGRTVDMALYHTRVNQLAQDGYRVTEFSGKTGYTKFTDAAVTDSHIGLFAQKGDELIIALRGTKSTPDLLTDLYFFDGWFRKAVFNQDDQCLVHVGFNKIFESYKEVLTKQIKASIQSGIRRITIVGHSLGGALANLTALYASQLVRSKDDGILIKLITFNAPRVGNLYFASQLEENLGLENISRFTVGYKEIAASLVFGTLGFKHAGTNVVVDEATYNMYRNHRLRSFENDAAIRAVIRHNITPVKANGLRTSIILYAQQAGARFLRGK